MKLNQAGINLIKMYEGWRDTAYRDAVGIWTIGYGHTSMAGSPNVTPGLKISKLQGEKILKDDLSKFAARVIPLIKVQINDNQFSALVSLAYNIGVGALAKSSALRSLNAGKFEEVPRKIQLFNKAGGRVLAGLVKRRASESALFMAPVGVASLSGNYFARLTEHEENEIIEARGLMDEPTGKSLFGSTTNIAAMATGAVGTVQGAIWTFRDITSGIEFTPVTYALMTATIVIVALVGYIIQQRLAKSQDYDV